MTRIYAIPHLRNIMDREKATTLIMKQPERKRLAIPMDKHAKCSMVLKGLLSTCKHK